MARIPNREAGQSVESLIRSELEQDNIPLVCDEEECPAVSGLSPSVALRERDEAHNVLGFHENCGGSFEVADLKEPVEDPWNWPRELNLDDDGRPIRDVKGASMAGVKFEGPIVDEHDAMVIIGEYMAEFGGDPTGIADAIWEAGELAIQSMPQFEGEPPEPDSLEELASLMLARQKKSRS